MTKPIKITLFGNCSRQSHRSFHVSSSLEMLDAILHWNGWETIVGINYKREDNDEKIILYATQCPKFSRSTEDCERIEELVYELWERMLKGEEYYNPSARAAAASGS